MRKTKIKMHEIKASQIIDKVKRLFLKANYHIDPGLLELLQKALKEESLFKKKEERELLRGGKVARA